MAYRRLFLFVEGDDDERFFEQVAVPFFRKRYDHVKIVGYARMKKGKLEGWVRSVRSMGADYLRRRAASRNGSFRYFLRKHLPEAL